MSKDHSPGFLSEAWIGFLLSLIAGALALSAALIVAPDTALRIVIAALGLGYTLVRLARSHERTGRMVVLASWGAVAVLAWLFAAPLPFYIAIHAVSIWLVRSLYSYSSLLAAALDFGLGVLSLGAAAWAYSHSASLFLSCWCFFLVQALHTVIPRGNPAALLNPGKSGADKPDRFSSAHRTAEAALRRLATRH
jgi:hypothetical protein